MHSIVSFGVELPNWQCVQPQVVRYLESKYLDEFFDSGRLRISTVSRFWNHADEERSDEHEGLIRISGTAGDGTRCNFQVGFGTDCLVLSTSCVEHLTEGKTFVDSYDGAMRIIDPVQFAIEIAKSVPGFSGGFQSFCVYRDSRHLHIEDLGLVFPRVKPSGDDEASQKQFNDLNQFVHSRATFDSLLRKALKYRHQNEYRFVWMTNVAQGKEHLDIMVPTARKFCRRVAETPMGPDLTVELAGAKVTILTKFDPENPGF